MKKPVAFLSYAHRDNRDGRLTRLRERLSHEVSVRIGEDFEIFQGRDAIVWGQNWKERIEETLDQITFLIPIITPSFFNSPNCRDELQRFLKREEKLGRNDLVLPIYYIDSPLLNKEARRDTDELARAVHAHQYADWRELRNKPWTSLKIKTLGQLATQVCEALEQVQESEAYDPSIEPTPAEPTVQKEHRNRLDELYTQARRLHRDQDWQAVADVFDQIRALDAEYPDPEGLLVSAQEALATLETTITPSNAGQIKLLRTIEGHTNSVQSVAFSPDGELLASGSCDNTVRVWGVQDGELLSIMKHPSWLRQNYVRSIAFSPDKEMIASGADDKKVRVWRTEDGNLLRSVEGHTGWVLGVAFSPDGSLLASSSEDDTVRLWRVQDGELLCSLEGHTAGVSSVAFSPDERLLASGSHDKTVRLWGIA